MSILGDAAKKSPQAGGLADNLKQELFRIDDIDRKTIAAFRGKRITFRARDGFTVGAIVVPSLRKPARSAVVLMDPDELVDSYDSLSAGLAAAGYSMILVEPRGSGWSVSPECPLPSLWRGREDEMRTLVARDVLPALRALSAETKSDTSAYLLIGALSSSSTAAEAATLQRAPRALVLLSPSPTPVQIGPMRARMARAGMPVFFEVPIMDHATGPIAQTLYEGVDPRTSRISESDIVGSSAKIFRYDRTALPRLLTWLNESWKKPSSSGSKRTKG
jgi:pimeloyl-ACP methyl ester carboxylesterase